jgi:endonuclease III
VIRDDVLLQEFYAEEPWKLLVCCILLAQTSRTNVNMVLDDLFARYPSEHHLMMADSGELAAIIRPCGIQNKRAITLIRMSFAWATRAPSSNVPTDRWVSNLYGVGEYGVDSYRIFVLGDRSRCDSMDKEILAWAERNEVSFV